MTPTLHHVPKTISSPIFQLLLELKLVPDTVVVKTLTFPELKEQPHLMINPMGTSPAFHDDDLTIWESGAILTWCVCLHVLLKPKRPCVLFVVTKKHAFFLSSRC